MTLSGTNSKAVDELPPDESIDDVIHHEVKELGTHMWVDGVLSCSDEIVPIFPLREFHSQLRV